MKQISEYYHHLFAMHLLRWQNTDKGRDFIKLALSYFFWKWPYKRGDLKMDRPEIVANKGYETFAEHFVNVGFEKGAEKERQKNEVENAARDKKIAEFFRSNGVSSELLTEALAIK